MRRRHRWITIVTALTLSGLLAGACTSADDGDAGSEETEATAGGPDAPLTASAPGVTEDTITIAYTYLDFEALVEQNLSPAGWGDQELVMQTMVDAVNEDGGINGRQLEVLYERYNPVGTEDAEAACLRLTEDTEVFAVVGGFVGPAEPANTCIVGRGETILVGGVQDEERLAQANAPWITGRIQRARLADAFMSLVDQEGRLEDVSLALVTNVDAQDVHDDVTGALDEYGVEPVEDLTLDAPIGDIVAEDAAWGPLAERIRGSGADTLLVAGNPSSTVRNVAAQGLDVEIWALDYDALQNLGATVEPEDATGTLTAAPLSGQDLWEAESFAECRTTFEEANPDIEVIDPADLQESDEDWAAAIGAACGVLSLFRQVATEAGEDLTNVSFAEAAAAMGDFSTPGAPFASLSADKTDANDSFALAEFDGSIGQDGGLDPVTDIIDVTP